MRLGHPAAPAERLTLSPAGLGLPRLWGWPRSPSWLSSASVHTLRGKNPNYKKPPTTENTPNPPGRCWRRRVSPSLRSWGGVGWPKVSGTALGTGGSSGAFPKRLIWRGRGGPARLRAPARGACAGPPRGTRFVSFQGTQGADDKGISEGTPSRQKVGSQQPSPPRKVNEIWSLLGLCCFGLFCLDWWLV